MCLCVTLYIILFLGTPSILEGGCVRSCIKNVLEPSSSRSLQVNRLTCKLKYRDVAHPKTLYHEVHYVMLYNKRKQIISILTHALYSVCRCSIFQYELISKSLRLLEKQHWNLGHWLHELYCIYKHPQT